ncbi:hypothetical protein FY557_12700 [Chryseobacterium sp. SN22]|uniref:hypothetical protein n=1 Tax=Chryseobacterium sp. SN22 TaxID=2606431 RepID=UPI0011EF2F11|nr:hypothetical protein [Chryseobacterium sp. SN22]KAA0127474.1 hypothetical protein FY557_12700 [Chryseobacterium sp. SN22]
MNHRVLELLKAPKNIQSEDLNLLKEEINSFPYVQNIRALYLYGVHLYDKENYQQVLSTTAAYTTDKKILYHLINGKIRQQPKPEIKQDTEKTVSVEKPLKGLYQTKTTGFPIKREDAPVNAEPEIKEQSSAETIKELQDAEGRILPPPREEIKHLYINGERNRILFEGEENFLDDDTVETIDLESTLESGSIVTRKTEKKEEPAAVLEENRLSEPADPETHEVQAIEEKEESLPETADEKEEINVESEEKKNIDESGTALLEESNPDIQNNDFKEEAESHQVGNTPSETVDRHTIEDEETATAEPVEEEKDAETSEADSHEIKVIMDALQEDNPEAASDHETTAYEAESKGNTQPEKTEEFTPETIVEEENISAESEKEEILDESELSFHETEAFMPEVQIAADEPEEIENLESSDPDPAPEISDFTSEKIINEDEIASEKAEDTVQDKSELSFHGTESFLPEVKIQANEEETINKLPAQNLSKHEDEMRRLIEEVEKKMKEKAASEENKKTEEPENTGHDISFAETQQFEVTSAKPELPEVKEEKKENSDKAESRLKEQAEAQVQTSEQPIANPEEEQTETRSWKPMSFDSNIPDSLLFKSAEAAQTVAEVSKEKTVKEETQGENLKEAEIVAETETEENSDLNNNLSADDQEMPEPIEEGELITQVKTDEEERVMNVSFFGSGWTIPQPEKKEASQKSNEAAEKETELPGEKSSEAPKTNIFDSNVPGFINTWQSWLKIDRTEEVVKEKAELKNKVIETFIENNPRISQLKEESSFVIKEKGDDISHLMTETLANLYFEQKLYTKAIKAFEILIKKTPEKKKYYEGKIQEIKDFRTKG